MALAVTARGQREKHLGEVEEGDQESDRRLAMTQPQRLQRRSHPGAGHAGVEEQLDQHQPNQLAPRALEARQA